MQRVLIVHASRHGGTAGIAGRIAEVLRTEGLEVVVAGAATMPDPTAFDACLVGGAIYMGSWVKDGYDYVERYAEVLARRPVWLFSSGPLPGSTKGKPQADPMDDAFGPLEGPGSGGRKRLAGLTSVVNPRGHRVFLGAYDPKDPPKTLAERVVRMLPASKGILPPGDFRDWAAIDAWAREVATELREPVAVG